MNPNAAHASGNEPADPHAFIARRHCLVLTLIGVSAIGISVLLPSEPWVPAPDAAARATPAPTAAASSAAQIIAPGQAAARWNASVDQPFDYFPAQFPTPIIEAGEQPPTF
jgi:hypothetical protein